MRIASKFAKDIQDDSLLLTPLIKSYLLKNPNMEYSKETALFVARQLLAKSRNRDNAFSASSAGGCKRAQVLQFLGYSSKPPTPERINRFHDGHWGHLRWQALLREMGVLVEAEELIKIPEWHVKGSYDGVLGFDGEKFPVKVGGFEPGNYLLEIKRTCSDIYKEIKKENKPTKAYRWQAHVYMKAKGLKGAIFLIENKDNGEWLEFDVKPSERTMTALERQYDILNQHILKRQLPDEECEFNRRQRNMCGYCYICKGVTFREQWL